MSDKIKLFQEEINSEIMRLSEKYELNIQEITKSLTSVLENLYNTQLDLNKNSEYYTKIVIEGHLKDSEDDDSLK